MAKITTLETVKNKMKELQEARAAQIETIRKMQETYTAQIDAAAQNMKQATAELNVDAYDEARQAQRKAKSGLEMYNKRMAELEAQEIISEPESDQVIDSLLEYEDTLAADFRKAIAEPIRQLSRLYEGYINAVRDTERTLTAWQRDIHANYSTRGRMLRTDPATGERTDRSAEPYPVHMLPYTGCDEAEQLHTYLTKAKDIYEK